MGDVVAAIITQTLAAAPVAALVGNRMGVHGDHASSEAAGTPYLTVQQVAGDDIDHLAGHSGKADAVLQLNAVGTTYASAQAVRNAVAAAWRAFNRGTITTAGGDVTLHSATVEGVADAPRAPAAGRDAPRFVNTLDLRVHVST